MQTSLQEDIYLKCKRDCLIQYDISHVKCQLKCFYFAEEVRSQSDLCFFFFFSSHCAYVMYFLCVLFVANPQVSKPSKVQVMEELL